MQNHQEQSSPQKGLRRSAMQRKRVLYNEKAVAQAPLVQEEEEARSKRRRPEQGDSSSISITQGKAIDSFLHTQEGEFFGKEKNPSKATINTTGNKVKREKRMKFAPRERIKVKNHPMLGPARNFLATTSQVDTGKRSGKRSGKKLRIVRIEQTQQVLRMKANLSRIAAMFQVTETMLGHSQRLLSHVITNYWMPNKPRELVVLVEISLSLIVFAHFGRQVVEHSSAVSRVAAKMNLTLKNEDFASVYARLEIMCSGVLPSAQQGASHQETFFNNAVDVDVSSQPTSAGTESSVELPPTSQGFDLSPNTKCLALGDLPRTVLEESGQPAQAGSCGVTRCQDTDPTLQAQETAKTDDPEVAAGDGQSQRQPMAISSEIMQTLPLQIVQETPEKLKSDRDQLLHSWQAKHKLEVQEFNASCAQEKATLLKWFDIQRAVVLASSVTMEERAEKLRELENVFTYTQKFYERDKEDRLRQLMIGKQKDIKDKLNAFNTKLQQKVTTGTLPDLLSNSQTIDLLGNWIQWSSRSPTQDQSKKGHQKPVPQVEQSASLPDQNIDILSPPGSQTTQVQSHPQNQTQLQTRKFTPIPPSNSQPRFQTQSQPWHYASIVPSSQNITCSQPVSQAISGQITPYFDQEFCTLEEDVAAQLPSSQPRTRTLESHSLQQNTQQKEGPQPSRSPLNILESLHSSVGSEASLAISALGLERAQSVVGQGSIQPSITEQARVSESINPSTTRQPPVSQTEQTPTNLQSRCSQTGQFATNLQPRVTQFVDTPTSLQARILQSIPASLRLLSRVPHTVLTFPPQVSQTADEENQLRREQHNVMLLYNKRTTHFKTEHDREATELRRKYERLLHERALQFEQSTAALKTKSEESR